VAGDLPPTPLEELRAFSQIPQLLFVAIFKHCRLTTGFWKNASGVLESPGKVLEFFVTNGVRKELTDTC